MTKVKVRQDYDRKKNQESRSQNEWDLCQQSSEPSLSTIDALCIFEKRAKMFNFGLLFLQDFHQKIVKFLTPQEYEDFFI